MNRRQALISLASIVVVGPEVIEKRRKYWFGADFSSAETLHIGRGSWLLYDAKTRGIISKSEWKSLNERMELLENYRLSVISTGSFSYTTAE